MPSYIKYTVYLLEPIAQIAFLERGSNTGLHKYKAGGSNYRIVLRDTTNTRLWCVL
jgi:hypothetical protein